MSVGAHPVPESHCQLLIHRDMRSREPTSIYYLQVHAPLCIYPFVKPSSPNLKATKRIGIWIRSFGDSVKDDVTDSANVVTIGRGNSTGTQAG